MWYTPEGWVAWFFFCWVLDYFILEPRRKRREEKEALRNERR